MTNRYGGKCWKCGEYVAAGEGEFDRRKWAAQHVDDDACQVALIGAKQARIDAEAKVAAGEEVTAPGMYLGDDGEFYKVKLSQRGRFYALKVVPAEAFGGKAAFVYAPGAIHALKASMKLTAEQAKEFGLLYGACVYCGLPLGAKGAEPTVAATRSVLSGYGQRCAERMDLPYVSAAEARAFLATAVDSQKAALVQGRVA